MRLGNVLPKIGTEPVLFHKLELYLLSDGLLDSVLEIEGAVVPRAKDLDIVRAGPGGLLEKRLGAGLSYVLEADLNTEKSQSVRDGKFVHQAGAELELTIGILWSAGVIHECKTGGLVFTASSSADVNSSWK
jgi:hypothetical protein